MTRTDPEPERQRLAEVYSEKTDGELEDIARDTYDLTEIARETLRAELAKRGLYVGSLETESTREADQGEFRDLVTIRTFWNPVEAEMAKGLLDAANIDSFLFDENMIGQNVLYANALGGIRLRVDAPNVEEANRVLQEQISEGGALDEQDSTP